MVNLTKSYTFCKQSVIIYALISSEFSAFSFTFRKNASSVLLNTAYFFHTRH